MSPVSDATTLASLAAILLSLLFSYLPGFAAWYDPLHPTHKRLIMLAQTQVTVDSS